MSQIETAEQAKQDASYYQALTELLYQLADDDFLVSFRGSEWLGLAPHIEADLAFSSITQNTMGHAALYYNLLEELGEGESDVLSHERTKEQRRNAIYLEKRNGDGDYFAEPYYDWALTVVRNFLYESFKKVKLKAVAKSSYQPLADVAQKVLMEQPYHLAHWKMWMKQLQGSTDDAKARIDARVKEAWNEFGDIFELGPHKNDMEKHGLIVGEEVLEQEWLTEVKATLRNVPDEPISKKLGSGRNGEHTEDLARAIQTLAEVHDSDRTAVW